MTKLSLREEVAQAMRLSAPPLAQLQAWLYVSTAQSLKMADAAIAAVMARQGWQPIETAPKDGTPFLAHMTWPENGPIIIKHRPMDQVRGKIGCYEFENNEDIYSRDQFSHWQPLPEPLKGQTND